MTYFSALESSKAQGPHPARVLALARWNFAWLRTTMLWFAGIVLALLPLQIWWAIDRYGAQIGVSIWGQFGLHGPAWFLFAAGVKAATMYLPMQVAMGATRGRHVTASAVALLAGALCLAALAATGLLFEATVYRGYGLEQPSTAAHLYTDASEVGLVFAQYSLRYLVFALSGMLAGLAYYRFGGLLGTVLLVVTLLPIVLLGSGSVVSLSAEGGLAGLVGVLLGAPGQGAAASGLAVAARLALEAALALATFIAVRLIAPLVPLRTKVA